jgi:AraC family transcriptional regulator of adaptative response / DNA-3-methyladenine glycosylase II
MELDAEHCYQAFLTHDRRFDGRVFAGVVTTGIYCRPICPVVPARFDNTRFFACAAAAEAAGFRPCRRCRPETAPGTPAWLGTSAVVGRALRLITENGFGDGNVDQLAERLGIGARQLRRLFAKHLGASPVQIARARRVHFARTLIDETDLPMTEVAFSAGFSSIRQFNHALRHTFRQSPTELRRRRGRHAPPGQDAGLLMRLPYRPPLDWEVMLRFLAPRATPGVEIVNHHSYRRTIDANGAAGTIEVWQEPNPHAGAPHLLLRTQLGSYGGLIHVVERVRRLFDLDADPWQIANHLRRSPQLSALVEASPGLRLPGAWDGFELAVRAILGQQVTVRGATTLAGRLVLAFGRPVDACGPGLTHLFPRPEALAVADLSAIGLPQARAASIRALAAAVSRGDLVFGTSLGLEDAGARLCAISGIGPWTANYIAMRAFGEPDAFPASDLGLRRALGSGRRPLSAARLAHIAEDWRPWRAYAAIQLWTAVTGRDFSAAEE